MRQFRRFRPIRQAALAVAAALMAGAGLATVTPQAAQAQGCPWMNTSKSPDARAHLLLGAMSLDDKISMLYGRGDLTYYGAANVIPANPALCIPALVFNDAGAGVGDGQIT
jgi:beta-glucosidase